MFLAPAVLIGLVAGLLLGGRLSRLAELRLRAQWLFFAAIGLQLIAYPPFIGVQPGDGVATALQVVSYGVPGRRHRWSTSGSPAWRSPVPGCSATSPPSWPTAATCPACPRRWPARA